MRIISSLKLLIIYIISQFKLLIMELFNLTGCAGTLTTENPFFTTKNTKRHEIGTKKGVSG